MKSSRILFAAFAALATALPSASWAAPADPVMFSQNGTLMLTLVGNGGLFDHVLELDSTTGPIVSPLLVASDPGGQDHTVVNGYPANNINDVFLLGSYVAGTELIFRMTNLCCDPQNDIYTQLFTGPGSRNYDGNIYANVTMLDSTHLQVGFEDLDPARDTYNNFIFDVSLTPAPVPVPAAVWMFGPGLLGLAGVARKYKAG